MAGTLDKFQRTFFLMSDHENIGRLVNRCNACLAKEKSIHAKRGPHLPSTVGNVGGESIYRLSLDVRNSENVALYANCTGWIYKIC